MSILPLPLTVPVACRPKGGVAGAGVSCSPRRSLLSSSPINDVRCPRSLNRHRGRCFVSMGRLAPAVSKEELGGRS